MRSNSRWVAALALCGAGAMGCAVDASGTEQTGSASEALTGPGGCTTNAATYFEQSVADIVVKDLFGGNVNNIPQDGSYCNAGPEQYYNNLTLSMQDLEAKLNAGTATIVGVGPGWVKSYKDQTKCVPARFFKLSVTDGSIAPGGGGQPGGYGWMTLIQNSIAHCEQYGHLGGAASGDYGAAVYIEGYGFWMNNDGTAFTSNPAFNTTDGFLDPGTATLTANLSGGNGAAAAATDQATQAAITGYKQQTSYASNGATFVGGEPCSTLDQVTGYVTAGNIQKNGNYAKCVCAVPGC